jgi:hypothetical protein
MHEQTKQQTKQRLLHGLIAALIASVGAALCAAAIFWGGALLLVYLKPPNDQGAWAPLFGSLFALPAAWIVLFIASFLWLGWRAKKRQIEERQEAG